MAAYFVIVGTLDNPLWEGTLSLGKSAPTAPSHSAASVFGALTGSSATLASSQGRSGVGFGARTSKHVMQLVAHSSIDVIEDLQWTVGGLYLKSIDRFQDWTVSAWLNPGGSRFILLHEAKNDEGIRLFFQEAWESYTKVLLNPFYELNAPVQNSAFESRIKNAAKKHL